eukprot:CAMPEP_0172528010 /NCGR_PEP_ID=MMETSP1067-20121228/2536_1 /TAXON_ID=265564 ORGANISM="Thalassiosira punctigera, Strain Tpunct2005C2" /NCGR_SAMPLE_ID=MMETSP1067 /ASSEMBLY_ACC=CAM_ASM_000444 /LENGTH=353 /DNA_ID=CAMNT_0013311859 /DNA_START=105 /DNA_END=1166 /DNA_ORIENTATION=-
MKAIQVHDFIDLDGLGDEKIAETSLSMKDSVPKPASLKKNQLLVKVLACSISPGDVITVQGNMLVMHQSFPFVPGMDICGTVVDNNGSTLFQNGDVVVASNGMTPVGGMAEYMAVDEAQAAIKPSDVPNEEAASSSSAVTARNAVLDHVKEGARVLILGGAGGVGSAAIQVAKKHGKASFVATTSTQIDLCKELGADRVVDYRSEDWWTIEEFREEKFDVVIDTVGGGNFYGRATEVLKTGKEGGSFVAVTGDEPKPDCRTVWSTIKFFARMPCRPVYTRIRSGTYPKYVLLLPYDEAEGRKQVLGWMREESLKIRLDEASPLPFTAEGVGNAFRKVGSGHAHGKIVVQIAKE